MTVYQVEKKILGGAQEWAKAQALRKTLWNVEADSGIERKDYDYTISV